jgi:hypothetical protein
MADDDRLNTNLSESVLTLLCFSNDQGALAASLVTAEAFENPYDEIAGRALDYRAKYGEAPGEAHIDDLFDYVLADQSNKRFPLFQRILFSLFKLSKNLNEEYVLNRISEFTRLQTYKRAIVDAANQVQAQAADAADRVESILSGALAFRPQQADFGMTLLDPQALSFLDHREVDSIKLDIAPLDALDINPTRKELFGIVGKRGSGKSMAAIHIARQSILQHWHCLYVSLELSEEIACQRLLQNMFALAKRKDPYQQTRLELDELGRLTGFKTELIKAPPSLMDPNVRKLLEGKIDEWGADLEYLRIKRFPSGQLTFNKLKAFLDILERVHGFVPDCLIVDYPGIMAIDPKYFRLELGKLYIDLRGMAIERNMAVVVLHQANRAGEDARVIKAKHAGEDISLFATADIVLTHNATDMEKEYGLARIFGAKVRNDRDKMTVVVSQAYGLSQYVRDSAIQTQGYWDQLGDLAGAEAAEEEDEE